LIYRFFATKKELADKKVTVESRDSGNLGASSIEELISKLKEEIKNRK